MYCELGVVVLNYNDADTTINLVSLLKSYSLISHIVIVDNCSTDDSYAVLLSYSDSKITVIKSDKNGGYGYGNNLGIKYLKEKFNPSYILICNPDVLVEEDTLLSMIKTLESDSNIGIVAPFMLNKNKERMPNTAWRVPTKYEYIFSAEIIIGHFLKPSFYKNLISLKDEFIEVDCVAGSLLMVNTDLMLQHGMYDENIFLFGEETTLGCKLKSKNLKTVLLLQKTFLHLHGVSINKSIKSEINKRKLLLKSRKYILKQYLGAKRLDMFLANVVYGISIFEYRLLLAIRNKHS